MAGSNTKRQGRDIQAAVQDLQRCVVIHPLAVDTLNLLADPMRGTDYDGTIRSGISDPTPAQAMALAKWHAKQHRIEVLVTDLKNSARLLHVELTTVPSDVNTADIARQARCSGGSPSMEPWVREECQELAVTRDGLCSACYQRQHHWQRKERGAA